MSNPGRIESVESLRTHLQTAVELELATLAPYMTALYSIHPDTNLEAVKLIRSVLLEEMYHLTLAANVINAVGGSPKLTGDVVPTYPTPLPHSDNSYEVNLAKFSKETLKGFLRIELPAVTGAPPEADRYHTIGQFYAAIIHALKDLEEVARATGDTIFTGDPDKQVPPQLYYGGGGVLIEVSCLDTALAALTIIIDQGEGLGDSILDGDHRYFKQVEEPAHYFRFNEVYVERQYQIGVDKPADPPTGDPFEVDFEAVYNMRENPGTHEVPVGARELSRRLDIVWSQALHRVEQAFNGEPALLIEGVGLMFELKQLALTLIRVPVPGTDLTVGPSYNYVPPEEWAETRKQKSAEETTSKTQGAYS